MPANGSKKIFIDSAEAPKDKHKMFIDAARAFRHDIVNKNYQWNDDVLAGYMPDGYYLPAARPGFHGKPTIKAIAEYMEQWARQVPEKNESYRDW